MLLERMSRSVGLECFIVEGYARDFTDRVNHGNVNHAWNVVRLSNKWYLADVTWASGYVDEQATIFTRNFNGNYFLTEPRLFIANHYPRKESWTLLYNRPTLKQFLSAPIKTSAFIQNKINQYGPEIGKLKVKQDSSVVFSFTTNAEYKPQKAIVEVIVSKSIEEFTYELSQDTKGEFSFSHCFTKKSAAAVFCHWGRVEHPAAFPIQIYRHPRRVMPLFVAVAVVFRKTAGAGISCRSSIAKWVPVNWFEQTKHGVDPDGVRLLDEVGPWFFDFLFG